MPDEIYFLSACELARLIRMRELSAREVTEAHLARIEAVNSQVNAVVTVTAERALREAAAADEHGMAMVFTGMRHFRH